MKLPISILLPVYNEGDNITKQINEIEKKLEYKHEIIIIYDFDSDNTVPPVRALQNKFANIVLLRNSYGSGLINAVKSGFNAARGRAVVVMPADLADSPSTINKMYRLIIDGCDIACATRYSKGGKKMGGTFIKTTLSRLAGLLTPLLLGIPTTDIANGFKMYRRKVLEKVNIESTGGWEFSMEIVIKAYSMGFKVGEIPTVWRDRTSGKSKFKLFKWLPFYIRWYIWGVGQRLKI